MYHEIHINVYIAFRNVSIQQIYISQVWAAFPPSVTLRVTLCCVFMGGFFQGNFSVNSNIHPLSAFSEVLSTPFRDDSQQNTWGFNHKREKKKLSRHSSLPWDILLKHTLVSVCVSVTDKGQSEPLSQITASSLAERTALTHRTDPRYEAPCLGWSLESPACPGSSDCPPCESWPASTQRETLLHRRCGDWLELLWQWHTQVGQF